MHYFSYISYTYSPKNKLEKAVYELLKEKDRSIVPDNDLIKFQGQITDRIEELNKDFPRCNPIKPYFHKVGKDYHLSPNVTAVFNIYASK